MPILNTIHTEILTSGGGTINWDTILPIQLYIIKGTATLTSNWTIQPQGVVSEGMVYNIKWEANIDLNGNTITIFGKPLPELLSNKTHEIICYYDGTDWEVNFIIDAEEDGSINATYISNYNVADKEEIINIEASFETNEQGLNRLYLPYSGNFKIKDFFIDVIKDIESTDDGQIKFYDSSMTILPTNSGSINYITAGSSMGLLTYGGYFNPELTFKSSDFIFVESNKVTPGGKVRIFFKIEKE